MGWSTSSRFFDVRVFNPTAASYRDTVLLPLYIDFSSVRNTEGMNNKFVRWNWVHSLLWCFPPLGEWAVLLQLCTRELHPCCQ